ncbi:MAG: DUF4160 domain-containing protein [Gammaproteobacteria bacterium]
MFFYSNEREPIHVHGKHNSKETKAEIHFLQYAAYGCRTPLSLDRCARRYAQRIRYGHES